MFKYYYSPSHVRDIKYFKVRTKTNEYWIRTKYDDDWIKRESKFTRLLVGFRKQLIQVSLEELTIMLLK